MKLLIFLFLFFLYWLLLKMFWYLGEEFREENIFKLELFGFEIMIWSFSDKYDYVDFWVFYF